MLFALWTWIRQIKSKLEGKKHNVCGRWHSVGYLHDDVT